MEDDRRYKRSIRMAISEKITVLKDFDIITSDEEIDEMEKRLKAAVEEAPDRNPDAILDQISRDLIMKKLRDEGE